MSAVLVVTMRYQMSHHTDHVRGEAISLARLLTKLPVTEGSSGWEQVLRYQLGRDDFAFGQILSATERTRSWTSAVAVSSCRRLALSKAPIGSMSLNTQMADDSVMEFCGPLHLEGGVGKYRIGFFRAWLVNRGYRTSFFRIAHAAGVRTHANVPVLSQAGSQSVECGQPGDDRCPES